MAGLPLKSGADFYNLEASRMRLHNLGADPTEVGAGLIYFNTSTGLNTSKKARLYTGSEWKTIAFSEDLDVASNADFLALKDKVELLSGDVDTDAIINNMKEVSAFLEGFAEEASLMNYLTSELGKKLDLTGGTLTAVNSVPLTLKGSTDAWLKFEDSKGELGYFGFLTDKTPVVYVGGSNQTLLHSGNVGEYAAGSLVAQSTNNLDNAKNQSIFSGTYQAHSCPATNYATGITFYNTTVKYKHQLAFDTDNRLYARTHNTTDWSAWKTIAFTDSNVASATKLEDDTAFTIWGNTFFQSGKPKNVSGHMLLSNATYIRSYLADKETIASIFGINASNSLMIGYGLQTLGDTGIYGKTIYFAPNGEVVRVRISESGAVYINSAVASDDTEKLIVGGTMRISAIIRQMSTLKRTIMSGSSDSLIFGDDKGLTFFRGSEIAFQTQVGGARNMTMTWNDGDPRVGVGTSTPTEKLHVVGNLLVEGNIIATGEVSAGGAGEESGEGGTTGGGGDALIYSQEFTPSTTSVSIAHNLSSTKGVIVQVWEKDTIAGTWNMVLVDIEEVDSNNIKLNFGRTETTLHKVVVMG